MVVVGTSICGLLVLTLTQRRVEAAGPVVAGGPSALPPEGLPFASPEAQGLASFCIRPPWMRSTLRLYFKG